MLSVRRATLDDSRDIFQWRNDELTRRMSHNPDRVEWDTHSAWFAASLANKQRLLVICESKGTHEKIGIVRFDINRDSALISINLSPAMRGKHLAKQCLIQAIEFFESIFTDVTCIEAVIKTHNHASKNSFEAAGFVLTKNSAGVLYYQHMREI